MFQALPHLQILRLKECPIMQTNCRLSCLRPLSPTLTSLNLSECDIDDEAITDLAYLTQLTWLHLKRSPDLAAAGAISLLALTNLRHLNLEGCISIDDQAVTLLSDSLHALTSLDIQNSQVSDRGVAALARGCSQLQEINLLGCPITSDSFPIFASWERLNRLDLSSSNENAFSTTELEELETLSNNNKVVVRVRLDLNGSNPDSPISAQPRNRKLNRQPSGTTNVVYDPSPD